ncbi:MAG: M28 family peptidase [Prevotella sp.]|nr:M28 family peptidase [Prevotella sp.]
MKRYIYFIILLLAITACSSNKKSTEVGNNDMAQQPLGPSFDADSAYAFCTAQCDFGPRTMNSKAHDLCGEWIMNKFREYSCTVIPQQTTLTGYDGTQLKGTNIIASYRSDLTERILICAHWDSRPWADNDPDSSNWHKPVMAANDGASGVAVMLEIARLLKNDTTKINVGVDFICFDAEDWGVPSWSDAPYNENSWALGAQHWSLNPHKEKYTARFGILLDMVGGQGAQFWKESTSLEYAKEIVKKVWTAAKIVGYGSYFPEKEGGMITDDHVPVNENAKIPTIDIIPYYPDCQQSNFGPTWHTVTDDMEHIDKNTLKAVGQTLIQVIYSE